jgi:DNA replication and repair protein RecF
MIVENIRLKDFRGYADACIEFSRGINALVGDNGQGKTSVLEAISYLSLTKSFCASDDGTVLRLGSNTFEVEGTLTSNAGTRNVVHAVYSGVSGEKRFTINHLVPETFASVIGRFPVVILSPENSAITLGGPIERRRFMDILLSQLSRSYLEDLLEYRRILKQRNRILLDAKMQGMFQEDLIEPWTAGLVDCGSRIIHRRGRFVEEFRPYVVQAYKTVVLQEETPAVEYAGEGDWANALHLEDVVTGMHSRLNARKLDEVRRGITLVGPHRDDLVLSLNGKSVHAYASQGQHKTFLVALKLAEFFFLKERRGEVPILLLDDVFSELDKHRTEQILAHVDQLGQTFITSTDESLFGEALGWNRSNRKFYVEKGTCRPA